VSEAITSWIRQHGQENIMHETSRTLGVKNCKDFPYDIVCKMRVREGSGRICFYSLCEAVAAGAFSCKPTIPVCEPH
jgi:hypothetical protein